MTPREQYNPQEQLRQDETFTRAHQRALREALGEPEPKKPETPFTGRDARVLHDMLNPVEPKPLDEAFKDIQALMAEQADYESGMFQPTAGRRPADLIAEQAQAKEVWAATVMTELLADFKENEPTLYQNSVINPKAGGLRSVEQILDVIVDATGIKLSAGDHAALTKHFVDHAADYLPKPKPSAQTAKPEQQAPVMPPLQTKKPSGAAPRHAAPKRSSTLNLLKEAIMDKTAQAFVPLQSQLPANSNETIVEPTTQQTTQPIVEFVEDGPEVGRTAEGLYKGVANVRWKFAAAGLIAPSLAAGLPSSAALMGPSLHIDPQPGSTATADTQHHGYFGGKPAPFEADKTLLVPDEDAAILDRHFPLPPTKQQKQRAVTNDLLQKAVDDVVHKAVAQEQTAATTSPQVQSTPAPSVASAPQTPSLTPQSTSTAELLPTQAPPTVGAPPLQVQGDKNIVAAPSVLLPDHIPTEQIQPAMVLDLVRDFVASKVAENTDPLTGLPTAPDQHVKEHEQLMDDIVTALKTDEFKNNLPPDQLDALKSDLTALAAGVYQPDILTTYADTMDIGKSPDTFTRLYQKAVGQELARVYGKLYTDEQMSALVSLMAHISGSTLPGSVRAEFVKTWQPILEPATKPQAADTAPTPGQTEKQPPATTSELALTQEQEVQLWTNVLSDYINGLNNDTTSFWQGHIDDLARAGVEQYTKNGVPIALGFAQLQAESNFNPNAQSPVGAIGIAQIMPDTARGLGIDPHDWKQSIEGQARMMGKLYDNVKRYKQHGRAVGLPTPLALAGYNAGLGNVLKYRGVPPYAETEQYIVRIQSYRKHLDGSYQAGRRSLLQSLQPAPIAPAAPTPAPAPEAPAPPADSVPKQETDTGIALPDRIRGLRYFSQWDKRWADVQYGTSDMKGSACQPTSMAIILSNLLSKDVLPTELADYNVRHHLRVPYVGTSPQAVEKNADSYGVNVDSLDFKNVDAIKAALDAGAYIMVVGVDRDLSTPATSAGHYYVVTGYTSDGFQVLDPNSLSKSQTTFSYDDTFGPVSEAWTVSK